MLSIAQEAHLRPTRDAKVRAARHAARDESLAIPASTGGGTRTLKTVRTADFESAAFAIPPLRQSIQFFGVRLGGQLEREAISCPSATRSQPRRGPTWRESARSAVFRSCWARSTPPTTDVLTGVQAIAVGGDHTCALMMRGGVRCWGFNEMIAGVRDNG
jgi:hypothetical protein